MRQYCGLAGRRALDEEACVEGQLMSIAVPLRRAEGSSSRGLTRRLRLTIVDCMHTFSRNLIGGVFAVEFLFAVIVTVENGTIDLVSAASIILLSLPKFFALTASSLKNSSGGRKRAMLFAAGFVAIDVGLIALLWMPGSGDAATGVQLLMLWFIWFFVGLFLAGIAALGAPRVSNRRERKR